MEEKVVPSIQLAFRHQDALEIFMQGPDGKMHSKMKLPPCEYLRYSDDGCFFICLKENVAQIFDSNPENLRCVMEFEHIEVRSASFSPRNSFLLTYHRRKPEDKVGNLVVWHIAGQKPILRLFITPPNTFDPDAPPIRWSSDEVLAFRKVKSGLLVLNGSNPSQTLTKISQEGISDFSISPGPDYIFALFTLPHKKNQKPGCVIAYSGTKSNFMKKAAQTMMAEEVDFIWNTQGDRVLCIGSDDVDQTGSSYYGAKRLFLLDVRHQLSARVPINEVHPLQSAEFFANGIDFVAIHNHPFQADIWQCTNRGFDAVHQFEHNTYNFARPSPDGRFLCLCGFGNLPGHMYFWDFETKKHLGHAQYSSATTYEWSPDGRTFLTSRLFPTRRVENGFVLWDYCGNEIDSKEYEQLYQTTFRPCRPGTHLPRAPSPERIASRAKMQQEGRYVPPHMRGKAPTKQNTKKRKKKKPKQEADTQQQSQSSPQPPLIETVPDSPETHPDPAKQIRKVKKKLKQIESLREKLGKGFELNIDQMRKLQTEEELRLELQKWIDVSQEHQV